MLKHLLNDSAVLKTVIGFDQYNAPLFSNVTTIKCKFEYALQSHQSDKSSLKIKPARMFCVDEISVGDIVYYNSIDYKVIQVNKYDDFDGFPIFKEVFLV